MNSLSISELGTHLPEIFSTPLIDFVEIDGGKITNKHALFEEFAEKLNFPDYFGFNWDAFSDCMTDLSWLENKNSLFIVFKNTRQFRLANPEEWRIIQDILLETIDYWRAQGRSATVIYL
ncbi:barstar family protein [Thiospirillum jenense]|uniref:Barstar family protein n=1 Tax=Thiospirillum jenense TaxID=1653858 RepID=A0A839H9A5_9GAMM|nr:barstar family protein [Thiospirillum jenense]MBB1125110.1 barstar family protein [Thiospirillum jenense]